MLVIVCGGFDERRVAMHMDFGWEIDVVQWLSGGGALGSIKVFGEEASRNGSVGFGLVHMRTSARESFGAGTYLAMVAIDGSMVAMW